MTDVRKLQSVDPRADLAALIVWALILTPLIVLALMGIHFGAASGNARLHCVPWVVHPTVLACSNGHSYVIQGGKLIDLGLSSGTPYLPKR